MIIICILLGGEFEVKVGYCCVVVVGGFVYVVGIVGQGDDVVLQCKFVLEIIGVVFEKVGLGFEKVVCVNYYLLDVVEFEFCFEMLVEIFGVNLLVVMMIECNLIDLKFWIEIELIVLVQSYKRWG